MLHVMLCPTAACTALPIQQYSSNKNQKFIPFYKSVSPYMAPVCSPVFIFVSSNQPNVWYPYSFQALFAYSVHTVQYSNVQYRIVTCCTTFTNSPIVRSARTYNPMCIIYHWSNDIIWFKKIQSHIVKHHLVVCRAHRLQKFNYIQLSIFTSISLLPCLLPPTINHCL